MLVFSRKKNESVVINDDIVLTVVEIRGDKIRLGITCPAAIPVHRQEVHDAIHGGSHSEPPPPRSPEERPFLQAVLEVPDDEGTRLVFADWLEERGDPLGEFLRNQCRLAKLSLNEHQGWDLEGRQRALWREHGAAWRATLPLALWSFP
jgi:carbon storage regulator